MDKDCKNVLLEGASNKFRTCLNMCEFDDSSKTGIYVCDDLYVKVDTDEDSAEEEYNNYVKIHDTKYGYMFVETPVLYKDSQGSAIVFNNSRKRKSLYDLWKLKDPSIKELYIRALNMVKELHSNNICHGDPTIANMLYDKQNDTLYFIDLDNLSFKTIDQSICSDDKILSMNKSIFRL